MAVALLVAAGCGSRLGASVPKAFVPVAGRPMLEWSLDALRAAGIEEIVVALPDGRAARRRAASACAAGRPARSPCGPPWPPRPAASRVVVHDAARPLVEPSLFTRVAGGAGRAPTARSPPRG